MIRQMTAGKKINVTPLLLITLLAIFSFIFKDYNLPIIVGYVFFALLAFVFIGANHGKLYLTKTQLAALMLAIVATFMVFMPYSRTEVNTVSIVLSLDIAMLYIIVSQPNMSDTERTLRILLVSAVIMSLYAVLIAIFPNIYYSIIKHILPSNTQALIELGFQYHYGISVGGETIVVDYYAFFGLVISLNALLICGKKLIKRKLYIAVCVLCALAIIVQNRKAELVISVFVISFLFLSNVNMTKMKQKWKQILAFLLIVVVGVAGFIYMLNKGYLSRYETFFAQLAFKTSSVSSTVDITSGRMKLWSRAFNLFKDNPVFGIGWGNFKLHLTDTYNAFNDGQLSNAHNNYLQLLCETGIIGFILFAVPLFYILSRTLRRIRFLRLFGTDNYIARVAASTSLSFQLFYLAISFIDPVWYKMFTWPFYGIAIILLVYTERESNLYSKD